jgi:hypothetical protein
MFMHYPQNEKSEMIQECHTKQVPTIIASKTSPSSYLNKAVISLDYIQMGNVVREENDKTIIIDGNGGNKFSIPSCKVISDDKTETNILIVNIDYQEAGRYRIVE